MTKYNVYLNGKKYRWYLGGNKYNTSLPSLNNAASETSINIENTEIRGVDTASLNYIERGEI